MLQATILGPQGQGVGRFSEPLGHGGDIAGLLQAIQGHGLAGSTYIVQLQQALKRLSIVTGNTKLDPKSTEGSFDCNTAKAISAAVPYLQKVPGASKIPSTLWPTMSNIGTVFCLAKTFGLGGANLGFIDKGTYYVGANDDETIQIRDLQALLGVKRDGKLGNETITALNKLLGTNYKASGIAYPGAMDTVIANVEKAKLGVVDAGPSSGASDPAAAAAATAAIESAAPAITKVIDEAAAAAPGNQGGIPAPAPPAPGTDAEAKAKADAKARAKALLDKFRPAMKTTPALVKDTSVRVPGTPWYKKWWFWAAVGGAAVLAGGGTYLVYRRKGTGV